MKEAIYSIARLSHVHESSKGLNSGFARLLYSHQPLDVIESVKYGTSPLTQLLQFSIFY